MNWQSMEVTVISVGISLAQIEVVLTGLLIKPSDDFAFIYFFGLNPY